MVEGWFYSHIQGITKIAKKNKTLISVKATVLIVEIAIKQVYNFVGYYD